MLAFALLHAHDGNERPEGPADSSDPPNHGRDAAAAAEAAATAKAGTTDVPLASVCGPNHFPLELLTDPAAVFRPRVWRRVLRNSRDGDAAARCDPVQAEAYREILGVPAGCVAAIARLVDAPIDSHLCDECVSCLVS